VPATFCGVVGLKPSYGLLPTDGLFPLAPSLDHAGLLARTPHDVSAVLAALGFVAPREASVHRVVVASCPDLGPVPVAPAIDKGLASALSTFGELGAHLVELEVPEARSLYETFSVIQLVEALKVHRDRDLFPARAAQYGDDVRGRLDRATGVELSAYVEATQERRRLEAAISRLFTEAAVVVTPVASITAPVLAPNLSVREEIMPFTTPQDLVGLPACVVRAGFDPEGLPVGVQITGAFGQDALVLAAARAFYDATSELQAARPELEKARLN